MATKTYVSSRVLRNFSFRAHLEKHIGMLVRAKHPFPYTAEEIAAATFKDESHFRLLMHLKKKYHYDLIMLRPAMSFLIPRNEEDGIRALRVHIVFEEHLPLATPLAVPFGSLAEPVRLGLLAWSEEALKTRCRHDRLLSALKTVFARDVNNRVALEYVFYVWPELMTAVPHIWADGVIPRKPTRNVKLPFELRDESREYRSEINAYLAELMMIDVPEDLPKPHIILS